MNKDRISQNRFTDL